MFITWIEVGIISKVHLEKMEKLIKTFIVPNNVRRPPHNIQSNYLSFKASQWCSWILIYSPIILKEILPDEHHKCWLLFVRACFILTQRMIKISDVTTADNLLEKFCKQVEILYGDKYCTPNMHLHLHLKQTILDFGPAHATWCFAFERMNSMLGSFPTNNKSVESQYMQRFLRTQTIKSLTHEFNEPELQQIFGLSELTQEQNTLSSIVTTDSELLHLLKL